MRAVKSKKYNVAFLSCKYDAAKRNISWLLSYDQWLKIWEDSGHLHERGCRKGQYVMARFGDSGPYAVGNVRIITCSQNIAERKMTSAYREKLSKALKGKPLPTETIAKLSLAKKGKKLSDHHKQRISKGITAWHAAR